MLEVISHHPTETRHETPLLFVHGAWHGAWCWAEHFLPYFAGHGWEVHALSLRGHGGSAAQGPMALNTIADYVADVAEVTGALARPPVVIGHSMGGFVTQHYAMRHPAAAIVLVATLPVIGMAATVPRLMRLNPLGFVRSLLTASLYHQITTPEAARAAFFSPTLPTEDLHRYHALLNDESSRIIPAALGLNLPDPAQVTVPVFVMGAGEDAIFSVGEQAVTAQAYNADCLILPGMAHDMMLEPQWEQAASAIAAWLEEQGF